MPGELFDPNQGMAQALMKDQGSDNPYASQPQSSSQANELGSGYFLDFNNSHNPPPSTPMGGSERGGTAGIPYTPGNGPSPTDPGTTQQDWSWVPTQPGSPTSGPGLSNAIRGINTFGPYAASQALSLGAGLSFGPDGFTQNSRPIGPQGGPHYGSDAGGAGSSDHSTMGLIHNLQSAPRNVQDMLYPAVVSYMIRSGAGGGQPFAGSLRYAPPYNMDNDQQFNWHVPTLTSWDPWHRSLGGPTTPFKD